MNFKQTIVALAFCLILSAQAFAEPITSATTYSCSGNNTLIKNIVTANSTALLTNSTETTACLYGCKADACLDPKNDYGFGIGLGVILLLISFAFFYIGGQSDKESPFRNFYLFCGLFMIVAALLVVSLISATYSGTILTSIAGAMMNITTALIYIVTLLIGLSILKIVQVYFIKGSKVWD